MSGNRFSVSLVIQAQARRAIAAIRSVRNRLRGLSSADNNVDVDVNTRPAIGRLRALASRISGTLVRASASAGRAIGRNLSSGIRTAYGAVTSIRTALVGLVGVGAITIFSKQSQDELIKTRDIAKTLGADFKELNALRNFLAPKLRIEPQAIDDALGDFIEKVSEAINDRSGTGLNATLNLGINLEEFKNLSTLQQFEEVMQRLANLNDAGLARFFGNEGIGGPFNEIAKLIPAIQAADGGFRGLLESAKEYSNVDVFEVEHLVKYREAVTSIKQSFKSAFQTLQAIAAPALTKIANKLKSSLTIENADKRIREGFSSAVNGLADLMDGVAAAYDQAGTSGLLDRLFFGENGGFFKRLSQAGVDVAKFLGIYKEPQDQLASARTGLETLTRIEQLRTRRKAYSDLGAFGEQIVQVDSGEELKRTTDLEKTLKSFGLKADFGSLLNRGEIEKVRKELTAEYKKALDELNKTTEDEGKKAGTALGKGLRAGAATLRESLLPDDTGKNTAKKIEKSLDEIHPRFGLVQQALDKLNSEYGNLDISVGADVSGFKERLAKVKADAEYTAQQTGDTKQLNEVIGLENKLTDALDKAQEAQSSAADKQMRAAEMQAQNAEQQITAANRAETANKSRYFEDRNPFLEQLAKPASSADVRKQNAQDESQRYALINGAMVKVSEGLAKLDATAKILDFAGRRTEATVKATKAASKNFSEATSRLSQSLQSTATTIAAAARNQAVANVQRYFTGGLVTGGSGGIDDIPAMLTRNEYVLPTNIVQKIGLGNLEKIRSGNVRPLQPIVNVEAAEPQPVNVILHDDRDNALQDFHRLQNAQFGDTNPRGYD